MTSFLVNDASQCLHAKGRSLRSGVGLDRHIQVRLEASFVGHLHLLVDSAFVHQEGPHVHGPGWLQRSRYQGTWMVQLIFLTLSLVYPLHLTLPVVVAAGGYRSLGRQVACEPAALLRPSRHSES